MPRQQKSEQELKLSKRRATSKIPSGNTTPGRDQALLLKFNGLRCLIPIQSIAVDIDVPVRPQVETWASENGWQVVEHREDIKSWACVSTLARPGKQPQNRVKDLRTLYTLRYLSYLVARQRHEGEITANDDVFMFSPWIMSQWHEWADETRGLTWTSEMDVPHWTEEDHAEFDRWLDEKFLADGDNECWIF